jgi:phosphoglycerate-specific signal transduction histidine kinase
MAVTNTQHLLVYQQAREHWGDETAEALMEMLPPAGLDVATKQDVTQVQTYLSKDIAQLRTDVGKDIAQLRTDVGKDIAQLRTDIDQLRTDVGKDIAQLRTDIDQLRTDVGKEFTQLRTDVSKDISSACEQMKTNTWKVTVGTGASLYLMLVGTPHVLRVLG